MKYKLDEIWIDEDAADYPLTREIAARAAGARVLHGKAAEERMQELLMRPDPLLKGKRILRLMRHSGAFVKPCPGTNEYICCGLEILHIGQGCPMDCTYCALQAYLNRPALEVFVNTDEMAAAVQRELSDNPTRRRRFCTGEFTDSLALDPVTNLSSTLVELFADQDVVSLEFKTKSDCVDGLLNCTPRSTVVVGFSMNAAVVSRTQELRSASLTARLKAARHLQDKGYKLAFHFDPILPVADWKPAYAETIRRIFESVDSRGIVWFSLGVLRFVPKLKDVAIERFGRIPYFHEGFLTALDGKSRLHVNRRIEIYHFMADTIRSHDPEARMYLCMESEHVWREGLGVFMKSDEDLAGYLNSAL